MRNPALFAALLPVVTALYGCNACAQKPQATPDTPTPESAAAIPAPPPTKTTITALVFQADDKTRIWMESRSGTITVDPSVAGWVGTGFVIPEGSGHRYNLSNNTSYLTTTAPAESTPLSTLLAQPSEPPAGYSLEVQTNAAGRQRVSVKPAVGQPSRLGMFLNTPAPVVWLEATTPASSGLVLPEMAADAFALREGGGRQNAIPASSTAVTATPLTPEALAPWKADLEQFRGPDQTIFLAEQINLDDDPEEEVLICIPAGLSNGCFVGDMVGEERRYHPVGVDYAGGEERPLFFQTEKGTYIMHSPAGQPLQVVRANGGHYATDAIR